MLSVQASCASTNPQLCFTMLTLRLQSGQKTCDEKGKKQKTPIGLPLAWMSRWKQSPLGLRHLALPGLCREDLPRWGSRGRCSSGTTGQHSYALKHTKTSQCLDELVTTSTNCAKNKIKNTLRPQAITRNTTTQSPSRRAPKNNTTSR